MSNILDFLQGASNSAASNVSAPIDGLAWLLRKAGVPVPPNALLGSQWMAEKGLTRQPENALAGILGESFGGVAPIAAAAKAPQIANALNRVSENAAQRATMNPQMGAVVYHGSPHKFDAFDASKIGTGEGAQAYGHGLYLADNPTVATGYKETLTQRVKDRLTIDGKVVNPDSMLGRAAEDIHRIGLQATLQKIDDNIKFNEKYAPDMAELYRDIRGKIASLEPSRVAVKEGQLYKVDLPDSAIARMLDWDKPLSQQASEVQKVLKAAGIDPTKHGGTGATLVSELKGQPGIADLPWMGRQESYLKQAGIPGIRYLDGGSRGAGAGTSNYVVFPGEENLLKILERNGMPLR